jgi:hypothetical protein
MLQKILALTACLALGAPDSSAQDEAARRATGHPDLQGRWTMRTLTPFARPQGVAALSVSAAEEPAMLELIMQQRLAAERFDPGTSQPDGDGLAVVAGERRTSAIVSPSDGRMALTPAGAERLRQRPDGYDGPEARPVNERCIADAGRAPYRVMSGEMFFEIIQTRDHLVIHKEGMDPPRIFPQLNERSAIAFPSWTGVAYSRWEGDAFVIQTTGFRSDDTNRRISGPGPAGFPIASDTRITEWLFPISRDVILYRYRVDDPSLFREPLVVELPLVRTTERLFESACHEGNLSLASTLLGARMQEQRGAEAAESPVQR